MAKMINSQQEGQTPIDDLSGLKLKIATREQLDIAEYENNIKADKKYLLKKLTAKYAPFTYKWLLQVHKDMFGEVWDWAGIIRNSEKSVGVPVVKIPFELQRILFDFHTWEKEKMPMIEMVTRLHHRLVQVHPFENGNGRWARMIANICLHKKRLPIIEWPKDKVIRPKYLAALKAADHGDYEQILKFHNEYWKE